jgi:homocysteine S-methyltransferase
MNHPFAPWLDAGRPVLLDGGLGSELERRGHRQLGKLWSAALVRTNPRAVREVHRDYLQAGAHVINTATFQAALPTLRSTHLHQAEAEELLREAADLALQVRDTFVQQHPGRRRRLVAASIGPYGASLCNGAEYTGAYKMSELELEAFHIERWQVLADTPVDLLACETIPNFTEVKALARLIFLTPHRWATLSLVCSDPTHLADGTPLKEVLRAVNHLNNLAAIGINCIAPNMAPAALKELKRYASAPLMIYANGSNSWNLMTRLSKDLVSPEDFAQEAQQWVHAGAQIIGGCCKTTPEHIRSIAELTEFQTQPLIPA